MLIIYFPHRISCRFVSLYEDLELRRLRRRVYPDFAREDAQPLILYVDYRVGVMSLPTM
jgi:hypothetical protein